MNEEARRKKRAAWTAVVVLAVFVLVGLAFVLEIRDAQIGIWRSTLSAGDKYLWFSRLQTSKSITALVALLIGLLGASYAWRSGQKPE